MVTMVPCADFLQDVSPSSPCGSCASCGESTGCRANPKQPWHPLGFCQAWCSCHLAGIPGPKMLKQCAQLVDDVSNVSRHQLAAGCKHSFFIPGMMILIDSTNFSGGETTKRRVSRHIKTYQDQEIVTSAVSRQ